MAHLKECCAVWNWVVVPTMVLGGGGRRPCREQSLSSLLLLVCVGLSELRSSARKRLHLLKTGGFSF